jgi:hypothetical protein
MLLCLDLVFRVSSDSKGKLLKARKKEAITELTLHCFNIYGTLEKNELMYVCLSFCTTAQVVNISISINFCESSAVSGRHSWTIKLLELGGGGGAATSLSLNLV